MITPHRAPVEAPRAAAKPPVKPAARKTTTKPTPAKPGPAKPVPVADPPEPDAGAAAAGSGGAAANGGGATGGGSGGGGSGSPLSLMAETDGGSFVYDYYLQTVAEMISRAWEPPAGLTERTGETSAVLRFRILANGRVTAADVETASTLDVFDRSARAAILRAQPFPPLPATYGGRWLMIHLKFAYGASQS